MEEEHQRISNDEDHKIDLEPTIVDEVEQDIHELSITPIPETFQDEIEEEQVETIQPQVDENALQQQQPPPPPQCSSLLSSTTLQENGSMPNLAETSMTMTTTTTTNDDRDPPSNHPHTLRENQQISDRSSPINGPGLAKPIAMTSSTTSSKDSSSPSSQHRLPSSTNPTVGKKRVDAALEKNIETIVTQVRRTTTKPSQLTQNDLQLFDSTVPTAVVKNGHHSRETTPSNSHTLQKQSSSSSREMTPDSINTDSANEDQQQNIRNGHSHHPYPVHAHHPSHPHHPHHAHQQRSARLPTSTVDLSSVPSLSPYGPQGWPPAVYPFAPPHHPGLYLPYPPSATTSSPTNGLPAFYPPYDPLLIEQHYGPQGLSAFYNQQQQQQQQNASLSGTPPNANLFRESQSLTDIFNHANKLSALSNVHLTDQQQQQMVLSQLYLNQISSLPFVTLYDPTAASVRAFRSNGDIDHLSSTLTTPTREQGENSPIGSGESIKSSDSITVGHRKKKSSSVSSQQYSSNNGSLAKVSPDRSSDGAGRDDADSVVSFESQKSATNASMPVLEDGLSDSECLSEDENPSSPVKSKTNGRHQSTQSDFLFDSNHQSLINASHKQQFAKSTPPNGSETQPKSFYIRPPPPSSFVRPVTTNRTPPPSTAATTPPIVSQESNGNQSKSVVEETNNTATTSADYDTDEETDKLLGLEHRIHAKNQAVRDAAVSKPPTKSKSHEENSSVLIEGVLFRCRYLGSTQLLVEGNPTKASRMVQAQEAVGRIKAPQGETQPSVEVDLFISTEKIMVLNTDLQDILMDHSLRSISYIADIGDLVVLMAKRRYLQHADDNSNGHDDHHETPTTTRRVVSINQKMICHVFESDEAQSIAHSIGQAFQVAYVEFLKANGIDDPSFARDIDYQEVLNQQEIGSEELDRFSKKECQKEVIVPKAKNEPLGIVIVESGWGSMLPTVVIANMMPGGPAARCGHLNIGDQIISVNGISLVGLPLSSCQTQIKSMKHLTTVRLVVVPCPPVVEVLIRRPDTKYQLGFSVQNGIICSLLRGGIAERGGVRVGHRIIEINGQSVVATQHERIVSMLSNSIGELRMKTMPTQMYRLLTGQENPVYI